MKRGMLYVLLISLLGAAYWFLGRHAKRVDQASSAPVLKADEKEKIIVDAKRHTVTTVNEHGTTKTFLNTHGPVSITEKKDGRTVLIQRTWGTLHDPYGGVALGADLRPRAALGLSLFYVQRWELGGGLLIDGSIRDTRAFAAVTYNAYSNLLVGLAIDNRKTAHILAALRF